MITYERAGKFLYMERRKTSWNSAKITPVGSYPTSLSPMSPMSSGSPSLGSLSLGLSTRGTASSTASLDASSSTGLGERTASSNGSSSTGLGEGETLGLTDLGSHWEKKF